jgi:hypothetical protein
MRAIATVVVLAAICTALDRLHMLSGTLSYAEGGQPWWVLLEFSAACGLTLAMVGPVRRALRGRGLGPGQLRTAWVDLAAFVVVYASTSFLRGSSVAIAAVLAGWWASRVIDRPRWVALFSVGVGLGGVAVEASLIAAGVFQYTSPDWLGVPYWLGCIYLHAGLFATALTAHWDEMKLRS